MKNIMRDTITKNGLILAAFAIITTGLIALTYFGTKQQIALQQQQKLLGILNGVLHPDSFDNDLHLDCAEMSSEAFLGTLAPQRIYRATMKGQPIAAAIETTAPDGYNGKIHLVVGISSTSAETAKISGVRVIQHKETPGLGDKIELRISDWILDFKDRLYSSDLASNWAVKKDGGQFDQFTGATITPRAVVNAVKTSAEFYLAEQQAIFTAENTCATESDSKPVEGSNE